jgi:hypothetical protein
MHPADLESRLADVLEENAAVQAEFLQIRRRWDWQACRLVESSEPSQPSDATAMTTLGSADFA